MSAPPKVSDAADRKPSYSRSEFEIASDFGSEYETESNRHERQDQAAENGGLAGIDEFQSESDGLQSGRSSEAVSLSEPVSPSAEKIRHATGLPETGRSPLVVGVWAQSVALVKAYVWPLAIAVAAVTTVNFVEMWPRATGPTGDPAAEVTTPSGAAKPPSTVIVLSAPAPGAVTSVVQPAESDVTAAAPVALPQPVSTGTAIRNPLKPEPPARPALNAHSDLVESEMREPALVRIPSAAPSPSSATLSPAAPPAPPHLADRAPEPIATSGAADGEAVDKAAIDRVLGTYQQSYSALDVKMVSTIWRGLDTRGLQRAFDGLDSQRMSFEHCDVTVEDDKATASCTGVLDYVRKIGQTNPLQKRLSWNFDLQRTDDRWLISKVEAR